MFWSVLGTFHGPTVRETGQSRQRRSERRLAKTGALGHGGDLFATERLGSVSWATLSWAAAVITPMTALDPKRSFAADYVAAETLQCEVRIGRFSPEALVPEAE